MALAALPCWSAIAQPSNCIEYLRGDRTARSPKSTISSKPAVAVARARICTANRVVGSPEAVSPAPSRNRATSPGTASAAVKRLYHSASLTLTGTPSFRRQVGVQVQLSSSAIFPVAADALPGKQGESGSEARAGSGRAEQVGFEVEPPASGLGMPGSICINVGQRGDQLHHCRLPKTIPHQGPQMLRSGLIIGRRTARNERAHTHSRRLVLTRLHIRVMREGLVPEVG